MILHGVSVLVGKLPAALDGDEEQESSQRISTIHHVISDGGEGGGEGER